MRIAIIGAGLSGVTTAYHLAKDGHEVTVFDRNHQVATETSFANGGQISISQPFPWNSPDVPMKILKWLGRQDAPLVLKLQTDPYLWSWAIRFLINARSGPFYKNALKNLKLGIFGKEVLVKTVEDENLSYQRETRGILKLFSTSKAAKEAQRQQKWLQQNGFVQELLDRTACEKIEPAIETSNLNILGGTYSKMDESGNAHEFVVQLESVCRKMGVTFEMGQAITGMDAKGASINSLYAGKDRRHFDAYVLCAGSFSPLLAKSVGLKLPIYPVKGYSVSIPIAQSNTAPWTSITDMENHVVISRLGSHLRAAGTAEINGYTTEPNQTRENMVLDAVRSLFPNAGDFDAAERWCGLRPMTPDCVPLIGKTQYSNLFLNTGHGHLGWTLSSGSAKLLSDLIGNKQPQLDITAYSVDRF
ncbi:D-amino acid dehydrogenase [Sneathiella limimaris]|uniref:D-amino acid dehydrogenase n=1 Tax=Sneathiella limimaris TaxID=1964213 RepID=UPI00146CE9AD